MTHTDLILISKDKYLHLGLDQPKNQNHLASVLMNELVSVDEAYLGSKQSSMVYTEERIARQDTVKFSDNIENEQQRQLNKETQLQEDINKYMGLSAKYDVKLTRTENEIMLFILNGDSIPKIASALGCSKKVIYTHKYNIIKKYGFRNFNELHDNILRYEQE
ncbi:helix-turn-helix transcriptional regulator [Winslowiella toletana]|uniref:helix-turn-helix transcriptional regulator n=1 Tax=Winslowiella toletana TaxID=92490 RepID=UPI0028BEE0CF|nr:LuxR C-terminal-related transcriptional regulator [Winslowiella toletana]WNN46706.1 LuxR C-terminal-related transcriptional regulator [Winslowiella toletana]